jgi:hypothetical protein
VATTDKDFRVKNGLVVEGNSATVNGQLTATGNITAQNLTSSNSSGDEGGEILLYKPITNTTIAGTGLIVDLYQNRLRFFEQGGTNRGYYIDITTGGASAGTNLVGGGGGGSLTIEDNGTVMPSQPNLNFVGFSLSNDSANSETDVFNYSGLSYAAVVYR